MRNIWLMGFTVLLLAVEKGHGQATVARSKASQLLAKMTLEEKVGQMAQVTLKEEILEEAIVKYKVGSVLNISSGRLPDAKQWNGLIDRIRALSGRTRLKIPVIYGLDDIHGANYVEGATLFPQQIGQAATFNPGLVAQAASVTAYEARAAGVPWNFSPVLDLGTNPLWPRIWEGYGEDPYLVATMGTAAVKGYQDPVGNREKVLVSLKHYLGYSDPKSGKDRTDAWIPEHYLREYHLPAFAAAVKAGARNVMVSSGLIGGIPTHLNRYLLTDMLKGELGFKGFVVTDWQDIEYVWKRDHIARDYKQAVMKCINAGIDMAMIPEDYKGFCTALTELVKEGKVPMSRINDAVMRILTVKFEMGLFDKAAGGIESYPEFASGASRGKSYAIAAESITLLKNTENILPIKKGSRILVCGPNANSMRCLNGGWSYSWQGEQADDYAQGYHTILEAMQDRFGGEKVSYVPAVAYPRTGGYQLDSVVDISAAVKAAQRVDVVVVCIGENSYTETPGNLNSLLLSGNQQLLVGELAKTGKPLVLVLNQGRPRIISSIEPLARAIVQVYLPSNFGGDALADILLGKVNPSGKLPYTYPRHENDLVNYIHKPSAQAGFNPQYPFGYGLSYTSFAYGNLKLDKQVYLPGEQIGISVELKNTGQVAGSETVLAYSRQFYAALSPDVKRLRRFEKISLQPGESRTVRFVLPARELGYIGMDNRPTLEAGTYGVEIGTLKTEFEIKTTLK